MADREFNVIISAETDEFSEGCREAEREASNLSDTLDNLSQDAEDTSNSISETVAELRRMQSQAMGAVNSIGNLINSLEDASDSASSASNSIDNLGNETSELDGSMNSASSATNNLGSNLNNLSNDADDARDSISNLRDELRGVQRDAMGANFSINNMGSSFSNNSSESKKFNREMERLSMVLGGEVPEETKKAYGELSKLHQEAKNAQRYYGKYSQQALNAREAITQFALGLDDTTFKQIYMRSQLGLTDMQLRQQANSIKLNARMTKLMGNQTQILTQRMQGLAKHGIKPEMMMPPSTIGQFQLLNETLAAGMSPLNAFSAGYRKLGGSVEKVIKNYSAQKVAIREAQGDMVKYGLLLRGITAANANMALAFPAVGLGALFAYKTMFNSALEADEGLKKLAETTKTKVLTALQPLIQVAGQFLEVAFKVVGAVSEWVTKFNKAHPIISKILGVVGFLAPAMTLLLLPLQMGIGLWNGWMVALNGVWTMFGGVVSMIGLASSTFLGLVATLALVGASFVSLYKNNESFKNSINELANQAKECGKSIYKSLVQTVESIIPAVQSMLASLVGFWEQHKNIIIPIVSFLWNMVLSTIQTAISAITNIVQGGLSVISGIINLFKSICEGDFKAMWDAIKEIFNGAIKLIIGLIEGWLVMGALKAFKGMFTSVTTGVMSMWNSVTSFFKNGVKGCINSITNLVKTGINNFNTLRTFGVNIFSALFQAVKSSMSNLGVAVKTSINNVLSFLRGINLASIGKNMIQGLVNGVKSMAKSLLGAVQGVVGGAINKAKNLLGINSPSKLFMQFGEWTTEGYEIGINRGENKSTRAVENFANNSINAFSTTALPASNNNSNSSIDNSSITININAGNLNSERDMYKLAEIINKKLAEVKLNKAISRGGARVVY